MDGGVAGGQVGGVVVAPSRCPRTPSRRCRRPTNQKPDYPQEAQRRRTGEHGRAEGRHPRRRDGRQRRGDARRGAVRERRGRGGEEVEVRAGQVQGTSRSPCTGSSRSPSGSPDARRTEKGPRAWDSASSEMWGHMGWPAIIGRRRADRSWASSSLTVFIERCSRCGARAPRRAQFAAEIRRPPARGHARERDRRGRQVSARPPAAPREGRARRPTGTRARPPTSRGSRRPSARAATWSATSRTSAPTCGAAWRCSRRSDRSRRSSGCSAPCSASSRPSRASRRRGSGGLSVGLRGHLGGAHRDRARAGRRHPGGARLQLPVHQDRAATRARSTAPPASCSTRIEGWAEDELQERVHERRAQGSAAWPGGVERVRGWRRPARHERHAARRRRAGAAHHLHGGRAAARAGRAR